MQLNYFDSIFENTSQTIIIINETGSILRVNSTIEKILGYKPDELVSENIAILMPAEQARQHHVYIQRYLETGKSNIVGQGREIIAKHKDGRLVTLFISISELQTPHGRHFIGIIFDLSELSLARESIKLELNLSRELATIQEMYIQKASAKELFNRVLTTLLNTTGSKYGFIGLALLDQNKKPYLKTLAITNIAWNKETHEFYEKNAPNGLEFTNLNTLFGHTLRTGETVITNDPKNHPASGGLPKGHPPLNRYMGIPIYGHNGLIAMAGIANSEKAYSEETLKQISPFIRIISSIIVATRQALELEKLAKTDALTQVANRNHFEKFLAQALAQAKEKDSQPALLLLDLNKFKGINDSYGHPAGDFILSVTAMRIREEISSIDLVARLGGDEFAVILSKPASKTEVGLIAQRIQDKTSQPIFFEQTNLQISVSIGVSCFPLAGKTTSTLLKHADIALYRSKKDGLIRFFDEVLETAFYRGQAIKAEVLKALRNKKIELHIQPIFNLSENEIEGGEILLRWNHPKLGTISPAEFIPLCEEIDAAK
jgi:diguanylate cyclase (GGDEF)-like protein/PAS domain S-box-containing protein